MKLGLPKNTSTAPVTASGLDGEGAPAVTAPPVVGPSPTAYNTSGSSRLAGWSLFTSFPSAWNNASCPVLSTRTARAYLETVSDCEADAACLAIERTTREYVPGARFGGIWALICPELVISSGSATLLSVTQEPPRISGSGVEPATALSPRFWPNTESQPFGATCGR